MSTRLEQVVVDSARVDSVDKVADNARVGNRGILEAFDLAMLAG